MSSSATSDFRRRRKANLVQVTGGKCNLCGYSKIIGALEFHHIDPSTKSYGISSMGTCHQLETDLEEVQKCILVCANCHREIHEGLYSQQELYDKRIYLPEIANNLIQQRDNVYLEKHYYCKNCGKEISRNATLCEECNNLKKRIVKRPNREELKQLIRTMPFIQIGKQFNVSDNAVRKWCKAENLPSKTTEIKKYTNEEWELI